MQKAKLHSATLW